MSVYASINPVVAASTFRKTCGTFQTAQSLFYQISVDESHWGPMWWLRSVTHDLKFRCRRSRIHETIGCK